MICQPDQPVIIAVGESTLATTKDVTQLERQWLQVSYDTWNKFRVAFSSFGRPLQVNVSTAPAIWSHDYSQNHDTSAQALRQFEGRLLELMPDGAYSIDLDPDIQGLLPLYAVPAREVLSQGDILQDVILDEPRRKRLSRVIVLSHSCEIDKPQSQTFIAGEIFPLQRERKKYAERIRTESEKIINVFFLPPGSDLVESYVDFRYVFRVYYADIGAEHWRQVGAQQHRTLAAPEKLIASLTDEAAKQLALKFAFFFVRPDLAMEEQLAVGPGQSVVT